MRLTLNIIIRKSTSLTYENPNQVPHQFNLEVRFQKIDAAAKA